MYVIHVFVSFARILCREIRIRAKKAQKSDIVTFSSYPATGATNKTVYHLLRRGRWARAREVQPAGFRPCQRGLNPPGSDGRPGQ